MTISNFGTRTLQQLDSRATERDSQIAELEAQIRVLREEATKDTAIATEGHAIVSEGEKIIDDFRRLLARTAAYPISTLGEDFMAELSKVYSEVMADTPAPVDTPSPTAITSEQPSKTEAIDVQVAPETNTEPDTAPETNTEPDTAPETNTEPDTAQPALPSSERRQQRLEKLKLISKDPNAKFVDIDVKDRKQYAVHNLGISDTMKAAGIIAALKRENHTPQDVARWIYNRESK